MWASIPQWLSAVIFFLGGGIAGLGGIFLGEDIGIRPPMGLLLLLKGWVASVVGGIGNIYGRSFGGICAGDGGELRGLVPALPVEGRGRLCIANLLPVILA